MPIEEITAVRYTTSATSEGGRGGHVTSADGVVDLELRPPGSVTNPQANPETLFAAGYSACFNGALGAVARKRDIDGSSFLVTANVSIGSSDHGSALAVELVAQMPGVEPDTAAELLEEAHQTCPYSKATRGNIAVTMRVA